MNETLLNFSVPWLSSWKNLGLRSLSVAIVAIVSFLNLPALAEERVGADVIVSGEVRDETDTPIPGVNVIVRGTTAGTTTNEQGHYSINVPDGSAVLVFSFIGFSASAP